MQYSLILDVSSTAREGQRHSADIYSNFAFLLGNFLLEYRLVLFPPHTDVTEMQMDHWKYSYMHR